VEAVNASYSRFRLSAALTRAILSGLAAIVLLIFALSGSASAFGGGYGPPGGPIPVGPGGGFPTIVTARTISPEGGTIYGAAFGASVEVAVPAGSISSDTQIVIVSESPCSVDVGRGSSLVADFGVVARDPATGTLRRGPFSPAISIVVFDHEIVSQDSVVSLMTPGKGIALAGASVVPGKVTLSLRNLPSFFGVVSSDWQGRKSCSPFSGGPRPGPRH
jgi:hypothetical protein